jgi:hypothetical protein
LCIREDNEDYADFVAKSKISWNSLARWRKKFDKDVFLLLIGLAISNKSLREQARRAVEEKAAAGDIQAAKMVFSPEWQPENSGSSEQVTIDQAIRILLKYREDGTQGNQKNDAPAQLP